MALEKMTTRSPRTPVGMYLRFVCYGQRKNRSLCWVGRKAMAHLASNRADWYIDTENGSAVLVGNDIGQYCLLKRGPNREQKCVNATSVLAAYPNLLNVTLRVKPYPAMGPTALVMQCVEDDPIAVAAVDVPKLRAAGREAVRKCVMRSCAAGEDQNMQELAAIAKKHHLTDFEVRKEAQRASDEYAVECRNRRMGR